MQRRAAVLWLVAPWLSITTPARAQADFAARFARAAALPVAEVAARQAAFRAAYRAFAELPRDSATYREHLVRGAKAALFSGAHGAAARLFAAAPVTGETVRLRLIALRRQGQGAVAVALAKASLVAHRDAVLEFCRGTIDWLPGESDFAALARLGGELLRGGNPDGLWLLRQQVAAYAGQKDQAYPLTNLGLALRSLGASQESEAAYREALRLSPELDWAWNDLALLLKGRGRIEAAFQALVSATKHESRPGAGAAGTNLGVLFQRTGKKRGRNPREDLRNVLRERPDAAMARRLLLDGLATRG